MKTILITGATDGIGLETARKLATKGHTLLLHGRSESKVAAVTNELSTSEAKIEPLLADFSDLGAVRRMAEGVLNRHKSIDVLINNAGVLSAPSAKTASGLDVRFVVNTLAPALLGLELAPALSKSSRVVNLSSAAQAAVDVPAMRNGRHLEAMAAYAQSKLALTIWTFDQAARHPHGPLFVAVNPGSLLASKMVKEGFGVPGKDINIGANILVKAALSDEFAEASGKYFDNDSGRFAPAHPDSRDASKSSAVVKAIEELIKS